MLLAAARGRDALLLDAETGALERLVKECAPSARGLCGTEGVLLSAEADRSFVHVWAAARLEAPAFRCQAPERLGCLACTEDGAYCAAGGHSGKLYLWELPSGRLLFSWDAHFKPCSALAFLASDGVLASAGEDAVLLVWSLADVLHAAATSSAPPSPLRAWTDHSLAIRSLAVAPCGQHDLLCSAAADHTVRLWRVAEGVHGCLHCFDFPAPLASLAVHPLHSRVYAGATDGHIFAQPLSLQLLELAADRPAAAGGAAKSAPAHAGPVSGLELAADGGRLFSCGGDGGVWVWASASLALLTRFQPHAPVERILALPRAAAADAPLAPLKKFAEPPADLSSSQPSEGALGCVALALPHDDAEAHDDAELPLLAGFPRCRDMPHLEGAVLEGGGGEAGAMRAQVKEWQRVNQELYQLAVDAVFGAHS
ncbi:hypothetical protein AB1Y20_015657 [Prymnesium parvum]|uniref:WD repeat-containing protein 18 n=1 Tax=Prymnesium parvum TaxID=97485 RepID=A0AB34JXS4_PRYPA